MKQSFPSTLWVLFNLKLYKAFIFKTLLQKTDFSFDFSLNHKQNSHKCQLMVKFSNWLIKNQTNQQKLHIIDVSKQLFKNFITFSNPD